MGFIKKTIQWIKDFFKFKETDSVLDDVTKLLQPYENIDEVIDKLKIREDAAISAQNELPATNSKQPDAHENRIELFFQQRIQKLNREANEKIVTYNMRRDNIDIDSDYQKLKNLSKNIEQKANNLNQQFKLDLSDLDNTKKQFGHEMAAFKQIHRLVRSAEYPESKILYASLIVACLLVESVFNGTFLAKGSALGLLGGVSNAIGFACLNIFPAIIIGSFILPLKNHIKNSLKVISYSLQVVYFSYLFCINYFIANYREQMELMSSDAFKGAIDSMKVLNVPMNLHSALLFFLGITFSLFIVYKGYHSDDKYPGYGRIDRNLKKAVDEYNQCRDDIIQDLDKLKKESLTERTELTSKITADIDDIKFLYELKKVLVQKYGSVAQFLKDSCKVAVKMYRDTNLGIRNTDPPAYFQKLNILPASLFLDFDINAEVDKIAKQLETNDEINFLSANIKSDVEKIYDESLNFLGELDDYFKKVKGNVNGKKK
jgi:hypothetical protein